MSKNNQNSEPAYYSFRPTYWDDGHPLAAILKNVKGTNRRRMITDYWEAGKLAELDSTLLEDETAPGLRQFLESLHPSFMGGEYLPDLLPGEVEIARIELQSTTSDVISVRAHLKPGGDLIHYRIVDEYESEFEIEPESSAAPLTQGELIGLIDTVDGGKGGGLALIYNNSNAEGYSDARGLRHFTTVSSTTYPDLFAHYDAVHQRWCEEIGSGAAK